MRTKTPITITLDTEDVEALKSFSQSTGIPISSMIQSYVTAMVRTMKATGWDKKKKHSKLDLIRFFGKGLVQQVD